MPLRIAATLSLLSFAVCLVAGGFGGGNAFSTVVGRALLAMLCTFVVGLIVGLMAQKMMEESAAAEAQRLKKAREAGVKEIQDRGPVLEVGVDEPVKSKETRASRPSDKGRRSAAAA